jgi:hypothetical protein
VGWLLLLLIDAFFLRWIWAHFGNWGFWDWDYQQSLLEATRISVVEYGELPLWNAWIAGGVSLAGNTLNHAWGPSILWILAFGTPIGTKLCLAFYLLLAQVGVWRLARIRGLEASGALLAAAVFTLGGVYAQRLTHGHFEWIAIAWMPHVLFYLHRWLERPCLRPLALGGACFAFIVLDGGPYQFAFFSIFSGAYALTLAALRRSTRPLTGMPGIALVGAGLAAIKLVPVYEIVTRYPREAPHNNFYGAPFEPTVLETLAQMFVSRSQSHDPEMWMPYVLNVGCYVGWITLGLASWALFRRLRVNAPWGGLALFFLWIALGAAAPVDLWGLLHELPFLSALRVPARFNVYVLLLLALLAGEGLELATASARRHAHAHSRGLLAALPATIALAAVIDLAWVNGEIFRVAFSIPPIETNRHEDFAHYRRSPHLVRYKQSALYPVHPNWPGATFPAILENRGVLHTYRTVGGRAHAIPLESIRHRGEAWMLGADREALLETEITPNSLRATTDGRAGRVVFNVNYDPGWRSRTPGTSAVVESSGLVAVDVAEGTRALRIDYRPTSFVWGTAMTLAFLAATAVSIGLDPRHRRPATPTSPETKREQGSVESS